MPQCMSQKGGEKLRERLIASVKGANHVGHRS